MKRIVVYYSLTGNTQATAEKIAKAIDADICRVEMEKPMPESKNKQIMYGGMLASLGMKPRLKALSAKLEEYDQIVLGTPIWATKVAAPFNTLFSDSKIADKVSAVFMFSGSADNVKAMTRLEKKVKNIQYSVSLADNYNPKSADNEKKLEIFIKEILG